MGQRASATCCNHRNKGHKLCTLAWNCAGFQHKNYKDCLIQARMGLAPISAKLVSTSLVLNQTGQIQTEICAALGRLPGRTAFSNFCCYNWNSGAEYFSSQLFSWHFVVLCSTFFSLPSRCTEFPQSWRSRKITDLSSHLFAQVAQTVANKRTMAKNGRGYHYTWCSPMPGTMVGTMEEINHPLVTAAPSVT